MRRIPLCLLLLLATAGMALAQGWEDDFDQETLDARWTWRVPTEGPTFSLEARPGWLRIRLPQRENGFNHWNQPAAIDDAPQLRTPAPEGDWELEARIQLQEFDPGSNFHVGLLAGTSDTQLLAWGPFYGPGLPGGQEAPEVWMEVTGTSGLARVRGDARDVIVRLTKVGRTYTAALRRGQGEWVEGGTYRLLQPPRFIGLIAKTFFDGPGITVDIDYVRLIAREARPIPPAAATVRVDAGAAPTPLSPLRFGHFIEHTGRCIYGGLWAEMLANRKFAGEAGADGVVEQWQAVGAGQGVTFAPDNRVFYAPVQSQRIVRGAGAGEACGIAQQGIALRAGIGVACRVVLRGEGNPGPVTLSLRDGAQVIAEQEIRAPGDEWQTHAVTFPAPREAVADATFRITFQGEGTLWVGAASLMPADNVDGWRRDVVDLVKGIQPPVLRWPGGNMASGYHWEDGIGPIDQRPVRWERAWGAWEPNDVGTHEFLRLCELIGAEPYIVTNAGEGDAREATRWVEYCNGTAETTEGRRRAQNGRTEPFGVKYRSIGNALHRRDQLGALPAAPYALKAVEFAQAMRAADQTIQLVGVGTVGDDQQGWNRKLLGGAGSELDLLSVHYYHPVALGGDPLDAYAAAIAGAADLEARLQETLKIVAAQAPAGKNIRLALDEWNVWPAQANQREGIETNHSLAAGLFACSVFNTLTRLGDRVGMANLALLVNALGAIRTTPTETITTPVYLAFKLHTGRTGNARVPVTTEGTTVALAGAAELPAVDAAATLSEDKRMLFLSLVNRHPLQPATVTLDVAGLTAAGGEWAALVGDALDSVNTPEKPNAVRLDTRPLREEELRQVSIPPHTAVVVTLRAR